MTMKKDLQKFANLSPLARSQEVQRYTDEITHFAYDNKEDILRDLQDEIQELCEELEKHSDGNDNKERIMQELGDVVFVLGNLANRYGIDCEKALTYSIDEYERRMIFCEENYKGDIKNISKKEMIELWKKAKNNNN